MNRLQRLTDTLTFSDQLQAADVAALATQGVRTIICNRPDNEEPGQPAVARIIDAARAHGITVIEQPVSFSTLRASDGEAFALHVANAASPTHAYCRTGRRCVALWALANARTQGTHAVLTHAATLGEDLRGLAPTLSEIEAKS
jgi:uncharacterized protein (TIGR01244 family)